MTFEEDLENEVEDVAYGRRRQRVAATKAIKRVRRAVNSTSDQTDISSAWYVGYAEDAESVDAIMKKFEQLEKMQAELADVNSPTSSTPHLESSPNLFDSEASSSKFFEDNVDLFNIGEPDPPMAVLNQQQLEELFKRTSNFSVKSTVSQINYDELDDEELWKMEFGKEGLDLEEDEEDDYQVVDDDFWEEELGDSRKRSSGNSGGSRKLDRESIINRYKFLQVQMQDRNGNFFIMKKKVSTVDPNLPTYVKIPPIPISRSWVKIIKPFKQPISEEDNVCRYFETANVLDFNFKQLGNQFQAILMDPPIMLPNEEIIPGKITMEQFSKLKIPSLITHGFLFIWVEKEHIPEILKIAENQWKFRYVENFAWIKLKYNNTIARQESRFFAKSKTTCLIFRMEGDIEMRHQRSPDCEFDFIKPKTKGYLSEEKPEFIYEVIQTLLPQAGYNPEKNSVGSGLLEL
ncbi:hypothetical protein HK096_003893 [Nowakowskiella sp. JEL0078]|nr:hypothetical protein HK096_003893 [Nowakowskiella sp. JEL0078]